MVSIHKAINPPSRLTIDSTASESNPTEPVKRYAPVFNPIVVTAAAIESHANCVNEDLPKFQPLRNIQISFWFYNLPTGFQQPGNYNW